MTRVSGLPVRTEQNNGIFVTNCPVGVQQVTDGMSHTVLFSEAMLGDGDDTHVEAPTDWFRIDTTNTTSAEVVSACTSLTPVAGAGNQFSRSGRNWVNGNYVVTRYNHVLPPNSRSCARCAKGTTDLTTSANNQGGATTASSRHPGGVNLVLADGSTQFVSSGVDGRSGRRWAAVTVVRWSRGPGEERRLVQSF